MLVSTDYMKEPIHFPHFKFLIHIATNIVADYPRNSPICGEYAPWNAAHYKLQAVQPIIFASAFDEYEINIATLDDTGKNNDRLGLAAMHHVDMHVHPATLDICEF